MVKKLTKTNISLLIIAICAMLLCGLFAINNLTSKKSTAMAFEAGSSTTLKGKSNKDTSDAWRNLIDYSIANLKITNTFDTSTAMSNPVDVSEAQDGSLYAYKIDNEDGTYDCVIYANVEKIYAPKYSYSLFCLSSTKSIVFENNCFDTSKVTNMSDMFYHCSELKSLDLSSFVTTNVTDMSAMFSNCDALEYLDISSFNTTNVTNMTHMFWDCSKLTSIDVSNFNTQLVTEMDYMFAGCEKLNNLDVSKFNTIKVTDMSDMFYGCSSLTTLDVSNFNTSLVTTMYRMFYNCRSLLELDVDEFNTSLVTDMKLMFSGCNKLHTLDVSNFDTRKVTNMASMFTGCSSLTNLDVSSFNTAKVTDMSAMFHNCKLLTDLDISNFNTSIVTNMNNMFAFCSGLTNINLSNLNTSNVTSFKNMFYECTSLQALNISSFIISASAMVTDMLTGSNKLNTIHAPAEANKTIALTKPFVEQGKTTEYTAISSTTNNMILVYDPISVTIVANIASLLSGYNIENLIITNDASKQISNATYEVDVSHYQDGYLMAKISGKNCVIYSDLIMYSPEDSSGLFAITTLKTINLEGLNTSKTTNMSNMFVSRGHDFTIKGFCNFMAILNGSPSPYVEGMTFVEFSETMGMGTYETEEEAQSAIEAQTQYKWAKTGAYDVTLNALKMLGMQISTFNQFHSQLTGTTCTETEEQCKTAIETMFDCIWAYDAEAIALENLTSLNISNFVINEGVNTENMLYGLSSLKTLYAPAECNSEIELPATMIEQGTSNEYATLSSASNGKTLILVNGGETPTTGFVDEQLLPTIAIGVLSFIAVSLIIVQNKKRKNLI